jgi:hypothetical protein
MSLAYDGIRFCQLFKTAFALIDLNARNRRFFQQLSTTELRSLLLSKLFRKNLLQILGSLHIRIRYWPIAPSALAYGWFALLSTKPTEA